MAVDYCTGFNSGANSGDASTIVGSGLAGMSSFVTTPVRFGTYALRCNPTSFGAGSARVGVQVDFGTIGTGTRDPFYCGFYFRYATAPSANSEQILLVRDNGGSSAFSIRLNSSGNLLFYNGSNSLVETGTTALSANTWYRIEISFDFAATDVYEVKLDGSVELSGSASITSVTNATTVDLGKVVDQNGETVDFYYADYWQGDAYIDDDWRITDYLPEAVGTDDTWTSSAGGSKWLDVDERGPNNDTDYIHTSTNNNKQTFICSTNLPSDDIGSSDTIHAVTVSCYGRRNSSPTVNSRVMIESGSTESFSATKALQNGYGGSLEEPTLGTVNAGAMTANVDPVTSSAWTLSAVDALEFGVQHQQAQSREMRYSQIIMEVMFTVSTGPSIPVLMHEYRQRHQNLV